jgi:hypothetical protein
VRSQLDARLRARAPLGHAPYAVQASVEREPGRFALELWLRKGDQQVRRRLVAPTCKELVEAVVWLATIGAERAQRVVRTPDEEDDTGEGASSLGARTETPTVASDPAQAASAAKLPSAAAQGPPRRDEPPAQPNSSAAQVVAPRAVTRSTTRSPGREPVWYRLSLGTGVWSDQLPRPQAQLIAGAGLGVGLLFFELRFVHLFAASVRFGEERSTSIRSEALTALGCTLFHAGARARLGPCLQMTGMHSVADARGTTNPERGRYNWLLGAAAAQAALILRPPLELIAELGVGIPLGPRPSFSIVGHGEVARASRLTEQASLAIGAHW